jgi:hypothetical protein
MADATTIDARPRRRDRRQQVATVTATQLGVHLGITRQRIAALADVEHVIERLPDGRFDRDACRLRYLNWLRDPARRGARSEAEAALQKQKSNWLALKIARYEREHITMEEHNHFVDTITGLFLTALGSLPAIMGGHDLAARRKWENFVYETRKRLADEALRLAEEAERNDRRRAG